MPGFRVIEHDDGREARPRPRRVPSTIRSTSSSRRRATTLRAASISGREPRAYAAIVAARDSGSPSIAGPFRLIGDELEESGYLAILPRYAGHESPTSLAARRETFVGVIVGVLQLTEALRGAVATPRARRCRCRDRRSRPRGGRVQNSGAGGNPAVRDREMVERARLLGRRLGAFRRPGSLDQLPADARVHRESRHPVAVDRARCRELLRIGALVLLREPEARDPRAAPRRQSASRERAPLPRVGRARPGSGRRLRRRRGQVRRGQRERGAPVQTAVASSCCE